MKGKESLISHSIEEKVYRKSHDSTIECDFLKKVGEIFGSLEENAYLCTRNSDGARSSVG